MSITTAVLALSLALDVFAAAIAYGLAGLPRSRWLGVAFVFTFFGVLLPLLGLLAGRWLTDALGSAVAFLAGGFLVVAGLRALGEVLLPGTHEKSSVSLEPQAIALTACVVALDNLAVGLALGVSQLRLGPVLGYLAVQAFGASLLGLVLGVRLGARLGERAGALGGLVFVAYGLILLLTA
ncbi:MAG: manganese efflux pump [Caulobacteraceae bacterium]|nr:manganese efflux pump [Caulobacteraceae bacterium]